MVREERLLLDGSNWRKEAGCCAGHRCTFSDAMRDFLKPHYRGVASLDDDCSNAESVVLVVSVCPTR